MRLFLIIIFSPFFLFGQTLTTSNLPIVVINTNGQTIVDDPRIVCDMGIIDNGFGNINSINDPYNDYNGKISIEYRGSSSQSFPKKPYALETQDSIGNNNNVSLLGMPVENDWILYAPYSDKSLMRNFLTFDLGRKMGNYSPRTVYCELVVNGDYKGIYILMEKIKRDNDRVDIAKLDSDDLAGDSLTGGYIIKVDKYTGTGGSDWLSDFPNIGGGSLYIQYHYPEASVMLPQQLDYIEHFMDSFEYALAGPNFADSLIGYSKYIDVNSFIDFYIVNELAKDIDAYRLSSYLYKDRDDNGGKLTMGPLWDFNLAYGNADYCSGGIPTGWEVNSGCGGNNPFWFERLLDDTTYQNKLKCRWEYLRDRSFYQDSIFNFIDSMSLYLNDAQQRNFQRWNILGTYVWPNYYVGNTYQDELTFFKTWISDRLTWIDSNILGNCYMILGCTDPIACNYDPIANSNDGSCIYAYDIAQGVWNITPDCEELSIPVIGTISLDDQLPESIEVQGAGDNSLFIDIDGTQVSGDIDNMGNITVNPQTVQIDPGLGFPLDVEIEGDGNVSLDNTGNMNLKYSFEIPVVGSYSVDCSVELSK